MRPFLSVFVEEIIFIYGTEKRWMIMAKREKRILPSLFIRGRHLAPNVAEDMHGKIGV